MANFWPLQTDPGDPIAGPLNRLPKYVASRTLNRSPRRSTSCPRTRARTGSRSCVRAGRRGAIRHHGRIALYFAYGTTQQGFTHHAGLGLGERVARVRTAAAHAVVVPRQAACSNPGCRYVHRMAALVPGFGIHAEGDLFDVRDFDAVDALELNGPYVRGEVELSDGSTAYAYFAAEPELWRALAERGDADALESYPGYPERLKDCCARAPGHPPPHDVSDPLRDVRRAPPAHG